jgi:hypothetical protein
MPEETRIRLRRGLTVAAVVVGLVTPASAAAVTVPQAVSFPVTKTGTESTVTVAFAAEGASEVMGTAAVDGDPAFSPGQDTCSGQVVTGACSIDVRFAPSTVGEHSATLRLSGASGDAVVTLTGTAYAVGPRLAVSPTLLTFQPLGLHLVSSPQRVTVTAGGDLPAQIAGMAFEGPAPGDFLVTADGCSRMTLTPGTSCTIEVRANPSSSAGRFARLRVLTSPPDASVTVGLTVRPAPASLLPPPAGGGGGSGLIPAPWSFGIVAVGHSPRRTTVRIYTSLPAAVSVALSRGPRVVRRGGRRASGGIAKVILRGRLAPARYLIRVVARRGSQTRRDSVRLRVR